jgi:hypothetical protein
MLSAVKLAVVTMALLLDQIEWGNPILPAVDDPAWEAEAKRRVGRVGEIDRRVAPNPWVRELCVAAVSYQPAHVPMRLFNIAGFVTAQENACRYCYGANRAALKVMGFSETLIRQIERDAAVADLDTRERAVITFCRNLARAKPRPSRAALEQLVDLGYSNAVANELALLIASFCFYNRIGVLTACPPERAFERFANGPLGRVMGAVAPLMARLRRPSRPVADDFGEFAAGPFGGLVATLAGLPAARIVKTALDGAFASDVVSRPTKALMFAIVGRALDCRYTEAEARALLAADGYDAASVDAAVRTLADARLPPREAPLLSWVRDTIHYQTGAVQARTRALLNDIGRDATLEAIGVAALANGAVRLAMLLA